MTIPDATPSAGDPWTIARVLGWATRDFTERRLESPRLDAEVLLAAVLGLERIRLILESERPLSAAELGEYRQSIQRRRKAEPVAYIVGRREFYGLDFHVDPRVLIPRPDTETLVEVALERTRAREAFGEALDVCTGSGCVAIAFAKMRPGWKVCGTDLSPDALAVARQNAERNNVVHTTRFAESDLFTSVVALRGFDLITANPPYVERRDLEGLAPDIREHEPRSALDGGDDGLLFLTPIALGALAELAPGGVLAVEIGYGQAERVVSLFERAGFADVESKRDYGQIERVISGRKPG